MLNLQKSISINAWYSKELPWKLEAKKRMIKHDDYIRFNKYGFFVNPYLESACKQNRDN